MLPAFLLPTGSQNDKQAFSFAKFGINMMSTKISNQTIPFLHMETRAVAPKDHRHRTDMVLRLSLLRPDT